jgi:hypothetical protein
MRKAPLLSISDLRSDWSDADDVGKPFRATVYTYRGGSRCVMFATLDEALAWLSIVNTRHFSAKVAEVHVAPKNRRPGPNGWVTVATMKRGQTTPTLRATVI